MAVSRLQEWRFHLVGTKPGYHSTRFLCMSQIWPVSAFNALATRLRRDLPGPCNLSTYSLKPDKCRPADSVPPFHNRNQIHSKRAFGRTGEGRELWVIQEKSASTKSTQSMDFAYRFVFISYVLYYRYTGRRCLPPPLWYPKAPMFEANNLRS